MATNVKYWRELQTLFDRINKWQILRHPHVLQVFGVSDLDADPPFIISQYYPNGNANDYLTRNGGADRAKIVSALCGFDYGIQQCQHERCLNVPLGCNTFTG